VSKLASAHNLRVITIVILLISSVIVTINSTEFNNAVTSTVGEQQQDNYDMVGLTKEEKWPVLRISFPGKPFPNSLLGSIFDGDLSAQQYISEMSGGRSQLDPTIVDGVWESQFDVSHWGEDSDLERDSGSDSGGARELATQAILGLLQDEDPSQWDLNGDYVIDRILILHSGQPQEEGGPSSNIWSHFSPFFDPVVIGDYRFEHYTMASVHGGLGVTVHEMLHQMGAVDLYDVHSESPTKSWYGLGDWDIMASGNWIEDGDRPSLPSSSTLDLIGAVSPTIPNPHLDRNFTLLPISHGGSPLKIEIAQGEYIWVSLRSDVGFDKGLPGHGILVEQQDLSFGDIDSNLVNHDPLKPWVKIVEADGNDALLRARDYGSAGDPFNVGDRFGQTGYQIWDNRGRLVPWTISVTSIESGSATIEFDFVGDENTTISMPRNPLVLLPSESVFAEVISNQECHIVSDLAVSGASGETSTLDRNSELVPILELSNSSPSKGTISGYIGCQDRPVTTISLDWIIVNHRISDDSLDATIPWDVPSTIEIFPETEGNGSRIYAISVDGPAGRIAKSTNSGIFLPGDPIVLLIEPDGLLEPRMIARGELVIVDSNNIEQRIQIVLNAEGELPFGPLNWLAVPSNAISTVLVLLALSIATGKRKDYPEQ
jgi:M6 family metalloprotease-like protein